MIELREATRDELDRWDDHTVRQPGGHVLQSRAWAEHRASRGWRPRFLVGDDDAAVLALTRPWPIIGGGSAYLPRGPVPTAPAEVVAARLAAATRWLADRGNDVVATDAEVTDPAYAAALAALGFRMIEEIQASRHRLTLPLGADADEAAVLAGVAKSTRQRIRQAERDGLVVVAHGLRDSGPPPPALRAPSQTAPAALATFHELATMTADRRHFSLGGRESFLDWTTRALGAGHAALLLAVDDDGESTPVAGLLLYRHGGRLSTALSGDRPDARSRHPGAFHLLRWRAIQLAIHEHAIEMDLGGVDVAGARHEPRDGEPMYGLYQHKRSFGATWVELPGAHERVIRRWRYLGGRVAARLARR